MEQKVAETILEDRKEVRIGGESYKVASPSIATLILFSKHTAKLPREALDKDSPIASLLQNADKLEAVGEAMASIILGAKEFNEKGKGLFPFWKKHKATKGILLAKKINKAPIQEVMTSFFELVAFMELSSFFQLTTSLIEMNLTKPTKEVVTTASGQ